MQSLETFRKLKDPYGEGQTLANMGILYAQQSNQEKATALWQEALTKLSPNSPKSKRVAEWLRSIDGRSLEAFPKTSDRFTRHRIFSILGGFAVVSAIAWFLLFLLAGDKDAVRYLPGK